MLKREFEEKIGVEVSEEVFRVIDTVYLWYPGINDKDQIADIYRIGGMVLIRDMLPRALAFQRIDGERRKLDGEAAMLKAGGVAAEEAFRVMASNG